MNILFLNLEPSMTWHFQTDLDLMLRHIEEKDNIYALRCNNSFKGGCGVDFKGEGYIRCAYCIMERKLNYNIFGLKDKIIEVPITFKPVEINDEEKKLLTEMLSVQKIRELMNYSWKGYDVGNAIASFIISFYREPDVENTEVTKNIIKKHFMDLIAFELFFKNVVTKNRISRVYIFNGRHLYNRMALRISKTLNVEAYTHDRATRPNFYRLYRNTYPHDLEYVKNEILEVFQRENFSIEEKKACADEWFQKVREGTYCKNFVGDQKINCLPDINKRNFNVGIFISSEDEFVTIDEHRVKGYATQNEIIKKINDYVYWDENTKFFVRVHPHLKGIINSQTKYFEKQFSENICIIPADSQVSTYSLINECDVVLSFGSTIGIEACYMKKPVILLGRATYEDLEGIVCVNSFKELVVALDECKNLEHDKLEEEIKMQSAIKYAWHASNCGQEFKFFKEISRSKMEYIYGNQTWRKIYKLWKSAISVYRGRE